jgi:hypothetical protein
MGALLWLTQSWGIPQRKLEVGYLVVGLVNQLGLHGCRSEGKGTENACYLAIIGFTEYKHGLVRTRDAWLVFPDEEPCRMT